MAGLPVSSSASRNRLLFWLLLGTLLLSTGLNLYLLFQGPEYPAADYQLDSQLPELVTEVELQQVRRALAECRAGHPSTPDSLSTASALNRP
ncbi:hypothetical protein HNQ93_002591 [Hymenobacter luteus]|uniref:Uncharacterized protein n=2 Tax=Hymenobacter TaxID=89966 RepID=A0A7W9T179_9BACT|nr:MULTISPECIES: hypothetical protein [Hymenobacter]MBB4601840.1 hypothetical protein [Hymenobacter latericoloratus]MBB6059731.1 hypothetical protein [Hymenobacter luteus]